MEIADRRRVRTTIYGKREGLTEDQAGDYGGRPMAGGSGIFVGGVARLGSVDGAVRRFGVAFEGLNEGACKG
ncbi:MAG: hypothetical protein IPJ98_15395 [Bryobacterales bacterium]|nr:hypothetical protein [Bryobacterales bacterium]